MKNAIHNILGIDWGLHDVGVALASAETKIALGLTTLQNDAQLIENLKKIISYENVQLVIIGIPSHVNRKNIEYPGEKLGKKLEQELGILVRYQDEMFTTKMAQQNLIEQGMKHVGKHDDEEAARIILEEWLDHSGDEYFKRHGES